MIARDAGKSVELDRRSFLSAVGVGTLAAMSPEDRAEEIEHYLIHKLDDSEKDAALNRVLTQDANKEADKVCCRPGVKKI